ncbi:hypothetical protein JTE90_002618 [Oedothorax gibbosus]|uniref:Uncharacterized protein n=1 Tax=Oedothorax gibbosus TaxID=931172 RepID=A0AAV6UEF1_9ARAC|nr:hypothetical protein JTE90_002618 [Oedothorax gibbosus]
MPSMTEDETVKLDKLKGERSQLRRVFTNAARRFSDVLESTDIQTKDISSDFNKVIEKAERLFKVDEEIKAVTFEYTDEEFDIIESYRDKLTEISLNTVSIYKKISNIQKMMLGQRVPKSVWTA